MWGGAPTRLSEIGDDEEKSYEEKAYWKKYQQEQEGVTQDGVTPTNYDGFIDEDGFESDSEQYVREQRYLSDGRIFYCPSHVGENTFEAFADRFAGEAGDILANYQYRGRGPREGAG